MVLLTLRLLLKEARGKKWQHVQQPVPLKTEPDKSFNYSPHSARLPQGLKHSCGLLIDTPEMSRDAFEGYDEPVNIDMDPEAALRLVLNTSVLENTEEGDQNEL